MKIFKLQLHYIADALVYVTLTEHLKHHSCSETESPKRLVLLQWEKIEKGLNQKGERTSDGMAEEKSGP